MSALAWLRRLPCLSALACTSYAIMLGIMVLSIVYDKELEPVITLAFDTGRSVLTGFDTLVSGSHWGQVACQPPPRAREHDSRRALDPGHIVIASLVVGIPLRPGPRQLTQRIAKNRDSADQRAGHGRACGRALHVQRARA